MTDLQSCRHYVISKPHKRLCETCLPLRRFARFRVVHQPDQGWHGNVIVSRDLCVACARNMMVQCPDRATARTARGDLSCAHYRVDLWRRDEVRPCALGDCRRPATFWVTRRAGAVPHHSTHAEWQSIYNALLEGVWLCDRHVPVIRMRCGSDDAHAPLDASPAAELVRCPEEFVSYASEEEPDMKQLFRLTVVQMSEDEPAEPVTVLAADELVFAAHGRAAITKWLQDHNTVDLDTIRFSAVGVDLQGV